MRALLPLLVLALAACADVHPAEVAHPGDARVHGAPPASEAAEGAELTEPGPAAPSLTPVVAVEGSEYRLRLEPVNLPAPLAAVQGEIRFDSTWTVTAVRLPGADAGDWHVVAPGRLRFAAVAVEGFPSPDVLAVAFSTPPAPGGVKLSLEELTDAAFGSLLPYLQPVQGP